LQLEVLHYRTLFAKRTDFVFASPGRQQDSGELSGESISDYSLSLAEGPLSVGSGSEVFAGVPVSGPAVDAGGGFDGYTPLAELAPYSTYIIRIE